MPVAAVNGNSESATASGPSGLDRIWVSTMTGSRFANENIIENCWASRMLFVTAPIPVMMLAKKR